MDRKRVLVVAWSAAEWSKIHPALERLPHLRSLVERGSSGPLTTLAPLSVPIVATTLATGFHPPRHGVLAEFERRPDGGGVQPAGRRSWRKPALWELLAEEGFKTGVVNWPATSPAGLWPGIVVDDSFAVPQGQSFEEWPLPPHSVAPESLREAMAQLRVHPREIGSAELSVLVPGLADIDLNYDRRPLRLAASLARSATVHAAATYLAETEEWDFLLARYSLLADVWRDLTARPGEAETEYYDGAGSGAYRLLDVMLGRLLELAGPDAIVFLVAAAGWRTAGLTAGLAAGDAADDAFMAFDKGMLVACGPGIKPDVLFHRADGADVAPTILACFRRSAPADGCVLEALFAAGAPQLTPTGSPPAAAPTAAIDPAAHLPALGYADKLNSAQREAIAETDIQAHRNLADSYLSLREWREAIVVLKALLQRIPGDCLANLKLGRVLLLLGDIAAAQACAEVALAAAPNLPWAELLMGSVHAAAGNIAAAEPHLLRARALGGGTTAANLRLGWAAVMLQRWGEAESSFKAVINADRTIAEAHAGLGISLQGQDRMREAEAALRHAIALVYDNPLAHFHLGQVLASRGAFHDAASALHIALAQNPALNEAKDMLSRVEEAVASHGRGHARDGA